jgi:hypothetical protein
VEVEAAKGVPKRRKEEVWRVPDIDNLVDTVDRVNYIIILLLHSWSTPHITAGHL